MTNSENERRKTTSRDFWRDEAKVTFLLPFERARFYLKVPSVVSIGGMVIFILNFGKLMQDNYFLFIGFLATLVYPVGVCVELYFKGGEAGARLKDESIGRQRRLDDKQATIQVSSILETLKHDLGRAKDCKRPGEGRADTLPKQQEEFDGRLRGQILQLADKANSELARIDNRYLLPTERIAGARNIHQIEDALRHLERQIEAVERHLE